MRLGCVLKLLDVGSLNPPTLKGIFFVWFRLMWSQRAIRSIMPDHCGCNPSPTISKVSIITLQKWPKKKKNQVHFTRSIFFTYSKRSDETTIKLGSFGHSNNASARLGNVLPISRMYYFAGTLCSLFTNPEFGFGSRFLLNVLLDKAFVKCKQRATRIQSFCEVFAPLLP